MHALQESPGVGVTAALVPPEDAAARWARQLHGVDVEGLDWATRAGRAYVQLDVHPDVWLIRWSPGAEAPMHDHGGVAGALAVVAGRLEERIVRPEGCILDRSISPGQVVGLQAEVIHAVRNRGPGVAYSIHVYAPALVSMSFYREDRDGRWSVERAEHRADWR